MPYNQSILEQELRRGEKVEAGLPWRLLVFSAFLFGLLFFVYLGMQFGYKPYLNSRIKNLDSKINNLNQVIDEGERKRLIDMYSQFINIQDLLKSHTVPSRLIELLEKNTQSQIYYLSLNFSLTDKSLRLEGVSPNYNILAQQLELFQRIPEIERVNLDNSQLLGNGDIRFSIKLIFKPELIH